MLKKHFVNAIGKHNYLHFIKPVNDLYHSACVPFKVDGLEIIKQHLIPIGGTVLDIGANVGQFTAFAAPLVGRTGTVYGFEPVVSAVVTLKRMVALRRFHHVRVVNTALSSRNGTADIKIPLKDGWKPQITIAHLNGAGDSNMRTEVVQMQTLDAFSKKAGFERVDFVKCDTEGHEFQVFSGGIKTLERFKPNIFCEVEKPYLERSNLPTSAVFELLQGLGYQCFLATPQGDLKPVAGYQTRDNYFFLHPSTISAHLTQRIIRGRDKNVTARFT